MNRNDKVGFAFRKFTLALNLRIDYRRAKQIIVVAAIQVRHYPCLNLG